MDNTTQTSLLSPVFPAGNVRDISLRDFLLEKYKDNVSLFIEAFPEVLAGAYGYEIDMSREHVGPDLLICISKLFSGEFLRFLGAGKNDILGLPGLPKLAERWNTPGDPLRNSINNLWLELDHAEMNERRPVTNFYYGPSQGTDLLPLSEQVFRLLLGHKIPAGVMRKFDQCLSLLPIGAWMPQVGMMLARDRESIRTYIHCIGKEDLLSYLDNIRWNFPSGKLSSLLEALHRFDLITDLDLDIHNDVGPVIGLECYFKHLSDEVLNAFLDFLLKEGLVCKTGAGRLLDYMGMIPLAGSRAWTEYLHHIKIIYHPAGMCKAKAYLGIQRNYSFI